MGTANSPYFTRSSVIVPRTRIDPHVKVLDHGIVEHAKRRGLDAIVFAPHFTRLPKIQRRASELSDEDLTILPGREIFTGPWRNRRHVLAIGLSEPVPDFIPLETVLEECQRQGASVLIPHPTFLSVSLSAKEIQNHLDQIDAVEVYNPKFLPWHSRRASALAASIDRPAFGSSYAHLGGTVGEVWTEVEGTIASTQDFQRALDEDAITGIYSRQGTGHTSRKALEFSHLFWENSWKKCHRVAIQGMEPTHPRHPAYDRRFTDVACY